MKSIKEDVPAASRRQDETRRLNLQSRLKEPVRDAVADKTSHPRSRAKLFASTGQDSESPRFSDANNERNLRGSNRSSGGAFSEIEDAPKMLGKKGKK